MQFVVDHVDRRRLPGLVAIFSRTDWNEHSSDLLEIAVIIGASEIEGKLYVRRMYSSASGGRLQ